jgi:hypothetical protein
LRVDVDLRQPITKSSAAGALQLKDFSQNNFDFFATGFQPNKSIIRPRRFDYFILSPKFERAMSQNKIRVKSFSQKNNITKYETFVTPLHEMPANEPITDDRRIGIEISPAEVLNDDMVNILSTLEYFDNAIGSPELVFATEYRSLRNLRDVYFNRLENKVSTRKFFEFYKWFDDTVGDIIESMIPSTSRYMGTNYVIESHMMERPKMVYHYQDMYVGEIDRLATSVVFMNQFAAHLRKI